MLCTRQDKNQNGVYVIINERTSKDVVDVWRKNDSIIRMNILYVKENLNVISTYAPQVGIDESIKREDLDDMV